MEMPQAAFQMIKRFDTALRFKRGNSIAYGRPLDCDLKQH